jgi:hypothetical protein
MRIVDHVINKLKLFASLLHALRHFTKQFMNLQIESDIMLPKAFKISERIMR